MPYILQSDRKKLDENIENLFYDIANVGELNYVFTMLAIKYMNHFGKRYETVNAIYGVFCCAKTEFYRRFIAPYEDIKIKENGDVV